MQVAMDRAATDRMAQRLEDLIRTEAEPGPEEKPCTGKADLHMHSDASDGTDTPQEVLERAREAGICFVGLTDHDTVAGAESLAGQVPGDVYFVPGIEFSCRGERGRYHILGYCCDTDHPDFRNALEKGQKLRRKKLDLRLAFLRDEEKICFSQADVDQLYEMVRQGKSVGKPHLGDLLVKYGKAKDRSQAIREIINRCPTGETRIEAGLAVKAIRAAGGIPVWAHPIGGEGEKRLTDEQFEDGLAELLGFGLQGLECWYSRFSPEECRQLEKRAQAHGLLISGGSDCHGENKDIQAGTLNKEKMRVPVRRLTILPAVVKRLQDMADIGETDRRG